MGQERGNPETGSGFALPSTILERYQNRDVGGMAPAWRRDFTEVDYGVRNPVRWNAASGRSRPARGPSFAGDVGLVQARWTVQWCERLRRLSCAEALETYRWTGSREYLYNL